MKREVSEAGQASFCQAGNTFVPSQRILPPLWHRPSESFGGSSCFGTNRVEQKEPSCWDQKEFEARLCYVSGSSNFTSLRMGKTMGENGENNAIIRNLVVGVDKYMR